MLKILLSVPTSSIPLPPVSYLQTLRETSLRTVASLEFHTLSHTAMQNECRSHIDSLVSLCAEIEEKRSVQAEWWVCWHEPCQTHLFGYRRNKSSVVLTWSSSYALAFSHPEMTFSLTLDVGQHSDFPWLLESQIPQPPNKKPVEKNVEKHWPVPGWWWSAKWLFMLRARTWIPCDHRVLWTRIRFPFFVLVTVELSETTRRVHSESPFSSGLICRRREAQCLVKASHQVILF